MEQQTAKSHTSADERKTREEARRALQESMNRRQ